MWQLAFTHTIIKVRIGFGLNGVQKVKDDEPLGFSFNANDAFSTVEGSSDDSDFTPMEEVDPLTGLPLGM